MLALSICLSGVTIASGRAWRMIWTPLVARKIALTSVNFLFSLLLNIRYLFQGELKNIREELC